MWTAQLLGCAWVTISTRAASNTEELKHVLGLTGAGAVLAWDANLVRQLEKTAPEEMSRIPIKLVASAAKQSLEGWQSLNDALSDSQGSFDVLDDPEDSFHEEVAAILFTSGTTSLPKGCLHTNRTYSTVFRNLAFNLALDETKASCNHMTVTHGFGMIYSGAFWVSGAKVVFPNTQFDPRSTLRAFDLEGCTHMPAVPSLLYSLFESPLLESKKPTTLLQIELSGAMILPEVVRLAREKLGAKKVSAVYGLTEGGPTVSWHHDDVPNEFPEHVSPGFPVPGAMLRICAQDSRETLKRGEPGEIHQGGPSLIQGYLGGAKQEEFYDDGYGHWNITGDQGIMLDSGELIVSGRFKDIIIRGGENISPLQIEAVINTKQGIGIQVVGATDNVSGEVPVAVVHGADVDPSFVESLPSIVSKELGPAFALDQVIRLEELGLDDFPKTTSGKIRKVELAAKVREFREKRNADTREPTQNGTSSVEEVVTGTWARLLGMPQEQVTPETSLENIVDSLTIMQFRTRLRKEHGLHIATVQLIENPKIADQIKLLEKPVQDDTPKTIQVKERTGPPSLNDMITAAHDRAHAKTIQDTAETLLSNLNLTWEDDVEDVYPMWDLGRSSCLARRRVNTATYRHAFWAEVDADAMMKALKGALTAHPIMRTLPIEAEGLWSHYAVIRATERWFRVSIASTVAQVETPEDLSTLYYDDEELDIVRLPGPLFRAIVVHVKSTNSTGVIYWANHACFDGYSLFFLWETLDNLLAHKAPLQRTHYKLWADAYYAYYDTPYSKANATVIANRFKGINVHSTSLFPKLRAPGCFRGNDRGWIDPSTGSLGDPSLRVPLDDDPKVGLDGLSFPLSLPNLPTLLSDHGIPAHVIVKTALSLMVARETHTRAALFVQAQACRSWPFMDPVLSSHLPSAADVDGPTISAVFCFTEFRDRDTVSALLQRVKEDQEVMTANEHAPPRKVMALLDEADREVLMQQRTRMAFNWLPGTAGAEWKMLRRAQFESRVDLALQWDCTFKGVGDVEVLVQWDGCQLKRKEVEGFWERVKGNAVWLCEEDNWEKGFEEVLGEK